MSSSAVSGELVQCIKCRKYINLAVEDQIFWGKCRVCKSYLHRRCMNLLEQRDFVATRRNLICFHCISLNESFV